MIFGQTIRYRRRAASYTIDDSQGASVAHAELLAAILQYSSAEAVHLYQAGPAAGEPAAITELHRRFPGKPLELRPLEDLFTRQAGAERVLYESGLFISPLAHVRELSGADYPICAIVHSLDVSSLMCAAWTLPLARSYDALLVSSAAGKRALDDLLASGRRIAGERRRVPRIHQIPLGVDAEFLRRLDRGACRHCLQLEDNAEVLLYLGRFSTRQKADLMPLLTAVRELSAQRPDLFLLLAGTDTDAAYSQTLEREAARLGIAGRMRVIRNFPPALKPVLYSAADVFVSPADNIQETFGLSLLEAMACELPVVASDWSGYREIVQHRRTGFLVPTYWNGAAADLVSRIGPVCDEARYALPEQTVVDVRELTGFLGALLENPELRRAMGCEGRARVETEYGWHRIIPAHESLWKQLLEERASGEEFPVADGAADDLARRFAHYATGPIHGEMRVRAREKPAAWDTPRQTVSGAGIEIGPDDMTALFHDCDSRPVPIRDLMAGRDPKMVHAVTWMLKRGYLEIDSSSLGK
jgi:glycosyltransferase involved in cell wall biosynthesis